MNRKQTERMIEINNLIELISKEDIKLNPNASSYPFFSVEDNRYSRFFIGSNNKKLFFFDKYTGETIYPYSNSKWRGFSSGGTMRRLVETMREWIISGNPTDYGCLYVPYWGSYWSIESRQKIIDFGKQIGYIKQESESYLSYLLSLPEWETKFACDISQYRSNTN